MPRRNGYGQRARRKALLRRPAEDAAEPARGGERGVTSRASCSARRELEPAAHDRVRPPRRDRRRGALQRRQRRASSARSACRYGRPRFPRARCDERRRGARHGEEREVPLRDHQRAPGPPLLRRPEPARAPPGLRQPARHPDRTSRSSASCGRSAIRGLRETDDQAVLPVLRGSDRAAGASTCGRAPPSVGLRVDPRGGGQARSDPAGGAAADAGRSARSTLCERAAARDAGQRPLPASRCCSRWSASTASRRSW